MTITARTAVVELCRGLVARGLVVGTAGNVSVRDGELFAVSPGGRPYDTLTSADIGLYALDGTELDAPHPPTSELALHVLVHTRPNARDGEVVLHTHAPASTALSTVVDEVPVTHYYTAFFGGAVRVAPYATFGTDELARHVLAALHERTAALMGNHGAVLVAPGVDGALDRAEYLEYTCDVALRALSTGLRLRPLDAAEIERAAAALAGYGRRISPGPGGRAG